MPGLSRLFPPLRVLISDQTGERIAELADPRKQFAKAYCEMNPGATVVPVCGQPISSAIRTASDNRLDV